MNRHVFFSAILCLALAACTSGESTAPAPAPEPLAEPAAAAKQSAAAKGSADPAQVFKASQKAYEAAKKACTGCPDPQQCQQALGLALQLTTAALQAGTTAPEDADQRAEEATNLASQFDGLAELSNECL